MTLDGTNTWVLRAPDAPDCVVIDPGEDDDRHLRAVAPTAPSPWCCSPTATTTTRAARAASRS